MHVLLTRINEVVIDVRGAIQRVGHGFLVKVNVVLYPLGDLWSIEDRGRCAPRRSLVYANRLLVNVRTTVQDSIVGSL